jgi:uncharacterized membrane protein HdeD (DUF308 family)
MTTDPPSTEEIANAELRSATGWIIALSVGVMILGLLAILLPTLAAAFFTSVIGWIAVIGGLLQGLQALRAQSFKGVAWGLGVGILYAIAGLYILFNLAGATAVLTLAFGWLFIAEGIFTIIMAFGYRVGRSMSWLVALNGIITLILGILVINRWPLSARWLIGVYVGISLLLSGASLLGSALAARQEAARLAP